MLALSALVCLVLAAILTFARAEAVWRTGIFFDSDDAMRAVQLRDFLAGQAWFDLVAHRIDPPDGAPMHWSRIVDVALAGLHALFALFLAPDYVERAMRLFFPFCLLGLLFFAAGWLSSALSNIAAGLTAVWLTFMSGAMFMQFTPGRIDHHAPQIVTLLATTLSMMQGLDPTKANRLAAAGALMAFSMAISLENLPFFLIMIAAAPFLFIVNGAQMRHQLLWLSGGLASAALLFYIVTVPPSAYALSYCDAFSAAHLACLILGAAMMATLALFAERFDSLGKRVCAVALSVVTLFVDIKILAPHCIGDPLGGLDPLLRDLWLAHVTEARPLLSHYAAMPGVVISVAVPVVLALITASVFTMRTDGLARRRWALMSALLIVGFAAGLWQTRIFTSVTPLAMAALAPAVVAIVMRLTRSYGRTLRVLLTLVAAACVSPFGITLALPLQSHDDEENDRRCVAPELFALIAETPPTRIVGPISLGAHFLAYSPHSVFGAPYHRNNHGNRIAIDAFMAPPEQAEGLLRAAGAGLVALCGPGAAHSPVARAAPAGLAAALARGETPKWLTRLSPPNAILLVFAFKPVEEGESE